MGGMFFRVLVLRSNKERTTCLTQRNTKLFKQREDDMFNTTQNKVNQREDNMFNAMQNKVNQSKSGQHV